MTIDRPNFQRLARDIAGGVILPEDAGFEVARFFRLNQNVDPAARC
jgi:hypothetical protein